MKSILFERPTKFKYLLFIIIVYSTWEIVVNIFTISNVLLHWMLVFVTSACLILLIYLEWRIKHRETVVKAVYADLRKDEPKPILEYTETLYSSDTNEEET